MEFWQILVLAAVGVVAGWLNVMAGGGSLLTVPVMLFMGIPGPVANGTNRIAILAQNVTAVTAFRRRGYSDFRLGLSLAAAASLGAIGGASLGVHLAGEWFDRVLALVMIGVMLLMATGHDKIKPSGGEARAKNLVAGHLLMVGAGFWGGLIQIGVGFILLSVSLITGFIYLEDMFAQHLVHKTVLSIVAWIAFAVLLWGRYRFGWRGRKAIRWTLVGFAVLMLAYFGSKAVIELILHR